MSQDVRDAGTVRPAADPLRIAVIIGSVREGRYGEPIGRWFASQARSRDDLQVDLVDVAKFALPVVYPDSDTARLPEPVRELGTRLAAADGFVVVTPEYNHSFPASLKNAIDWFYDEWNAKPVGFVSYGGRAEGIRAVEQLRQIFVELHAMTTRDGVSFNLEDGSVDEHGWPAADAEPAAKRLLDQLVWWAQALREARAARPL